MLLLPLVTGFPSALWSGLLDCNIKAKKIVRKWNVVFAKKRSKTHKRLNRTLFNQAAQDKIRKFARESSSSKPHTIYILKTKDSPEKLPILFCFVWLKSVPINLLCVFFLSFKSSSFICLSSFFFFSSFFPITTNIFKPGKMSYLSTKHFFVSAGLESRTTPCTMTTTSSCTSQPSCP